MLAPRIECPRCLRPVVTCYCPHLQRLATRTKVVVLQHPREAENAIGTARMAALCLESAEVAVGVDFAEDARVQALVSDPSRPAILLYPGPASKDLAKEPPPHPVTLVVVDGTWHQARSLMNRNPWLRALPQYAFEPEAPSEYRIRREPRPDYVSTIEALTAALGLLEGDRTRFEGLLAPFRAMVDKQLEYVAKSTGARTRSRRRHDAPGPSRLPKELTTMRPVCVAGEANAWPYDRATRSTPYPHELMQWAAHRLDDAAHFEAFIAPRQPLSLAAIHHAKLDEPSVRAGMSLEEFRARWQGFYRPDDVICAWGRYVPDLLRRERGTLPPKVIDMRKVVGDVLRRRPGSAEDVIELLGLAWEPRGIGRCGERLGKLIAITEFLRSGGRVKPLLTG